MVNWVEVYQLIKIVSSDIKKHYKEQYTRELIPYIDALDIEEKNKVVIKKNVENFINAISKYAKEIMKLTNEDISKLAKFDALFDLLQNPENDTVDEDIREELSGSTLFDYALGKNIPIKDIFDLYEQTPKKIRYKYYELNNDKWNELMETMSRALGNINHYYNVCELTDDVSRILNDQFINYVLDGLNIASLVGEKK